MLQRSLCILTLLCCSIVVVPALGHAQQTDTSHDPGQLFLEANRAYTEGRYDAAASYYEQIIARGHRTADLYYNAGNAYYKNGMIGKAIANYRKALLLAPRDEDLHANLSLALEQTVDKIECPDTLSIVSGLCFWYPLMTVGELGAVFLTAHFLFWLLLALRQFSRSDVMTILLYICLFVTFLFGLSFGVKAYTTYQAPEGVVVARELTVRAGTSGNDTALFKLHEGATFKWKEETENWAKIELCDGKKGWVQKESIEKISLR